MINIVLIEPEIPQNTGNIARTCAAVGARLHLVEPMGFKIDDAKLKRAGLDYWYSLEIKYYKNTDEFFLKNTGGNFIFFTTKAAKLYTEADYGGEPFLIFGKETAGISEDILKANLECCVRIPMRGGLRSLNLSNCAAVAVYEALRRRDFAGLETAGKFADL
ncbi:MAG: tRNA (cytidine(34)-2'-O)-methyltransferase [Oscillospiraceae bacterium]|nr:tRNA (cytidine(34)-2'-O)-methyltransferase [Oscillospiraceae bacterium]